VAEFPVTEAAARGARSGGQSVIAGAPNVVRGGSHTGNVAVAALLAAGLVDALASDYVPASLIEAAFIAASAHGVALPAAVALISSAPASMVGLRDRGRIAPGLRADLVRVRMHEGAPVVRQVWRAGERVI
jgi:alpha-D-ribose 1-methylphosphonate 5-triphosphate diphosphatase